MRSIAIRWRGSASRGVLLRFLAGKWTGAAATFFVSSTAVAQPFQGSIVGWGSDVVGVDLAQGFVGIAAGGYHNLGLKADGSIVAWGFNRVGQTDVPTPNTGFVAVAAGGYYGLGLKADGSIVAWGDNTFGLTNVPAPNTGFLAVAAGGNHSLAIRRVAGDSDADGDVDWADYAMFVGYGLGPATGPQLAGWLFYDSDLDSDVDLRDVAAWTMRFTGPL